MHYHLPALTCVLFSLNVFVCNIASKLPPVCAASRARTCIHCDGPYESAWDRRVLVFVFFVILKCGYHQSLFTDGFIISTPFCCSSSLGSPSPGFLCIIPQILNVFFLH